MKKRSPTPNCPILEANDIDISQSGYETKNYSGMTTKEIADPCTECPAGECFFEVTREARRRVVAVLDKCIRKRDTLIRQCEYLYQKEDKE